MAECLEDLDLDFDFYNMNRTKTNIMNNTSILQLVDLVEKEGLNNLELSDIHFPDGIIFNRIQRLDKVEKIKLTNTNISTLANFPLNIKKLTIKKGEIYIANFKFISVEAINITIIDNKVRTILYLNELKNLVYLDLSHNNIEEIPQLPKNVMTFIASHNKIKQIRNLNSKLVDLNLSNNLISDLTMIPHSIESINISRNQIKIVDLSPFMQLKVFKAYNNRIDLIIGPISPSIEVFDVFNNELQQIPDIGLHIKEMDLSNNDLKVLPKFGTSVLERLDITRNPLLKLSEDEIFMLMEINKLNNTLVVICDDFDMPHNIKDLHLSSSPSSSSSELDFSDIYDNIDIKPTKETSSMKHFDIIELLNRNRNKQNNQQNNQQIIIRGKQIYKRRIYEM